MEQLLIDDVLCARVTWPALHHPSHLAHIILIFLPYFFQPKGRKKCIPLSSVTRTFRTRRWMQPVRRADIELPAISFFQSTRPIEWDSTWFDLKVTNNDVPAVGVSARWLVSSAGCSPGSRATAVGYLLCRTTKGKINQHQEDDESHFFSIISIRTTTTTNKKNREKSFHSFCRFLVENEPLILIPILLIWCRNTVALLPFFFPLGSLSTLSRSTRSWRQTGPSPAKVFWSISFSLFWFIKKHR